MQRFFRRSGERPFVMAGPCSAESEEQVLEAAVAMQERGVDLFRSGIWKPRTRPDSFAGVGPDGFSWLNRVQGELEMPVAIEVANARHVEIALKHGMDVLWVGARTTANPFSMQEIADVLSGVSVPVMVKNPINPDLYLWLGALERLERAGITDLALIHRGFSFFNTKKYRNSPLWQIPIDMRSLRPDLMMLCDISHISGRRDLLKDVAQAAMDLAFDGLMIETHPNPDAALSDAQQQIDPATFDDLFSTLTIRRTPMKVVVEKTPMHSLRDQIDQLDDELVSLLGRRMQLAEEIGMIKDTYEIPVLQPERWRQILERAIVNAGVQNLTVDFIEELFKAIHQESIGHQLEVMNARRALDTST